LLILAIISAGISAALISSYLFARLFVLIRVDGRAGLSEWSNETKSLFIRGEPEEEKGRRPSSGSTGSVVVVKHEPEQTHVEPPSKKVNPPEETNDFKHNPFITDSSSPFEL
jgi:hypothetical protein